MSNFSHHEPCPKCNSKDNLGVWSDGSKWCFGCGYKVYSTSKSLEDVANQFNNKKEESHGIILPDDFSFHIPKEPLAWLRQYNLEAEELRSNSIGWSESNKMLIYPFFDGDNNILLWQGRYFPRQNPKTYTKGYPEKHILIHKSSNETNDNCVVVEDVISSIKVGRVMDCTVLLGSHLSMHKAVGLSRLYSNLILWLDPDKIKEMFKYTERYKPLFNNVRYIISDRDPKDFSTELIRSYLNE